MRARNVFLVMAEEGDYEEWRQWPVRVYPSKAAAAAEVERLQQEEARFAAQADRARDMYDALAIDGTAPPDDAWELMNKRLTRIARRMNALDRGARSSYDRTRYSMAPIPLVDGTHLRRREASHD